MSILDKQDYTLIERLTSLSQGQLKNVMTKFLKQRYDKVIARKEYIVAVGDIPIALVAHMDTVFKFPVSNLYYDTKKEVLWSPEGLGADDRAGVFAIIKILQSDLRPSVILTTDEEKGGIGASKLSDKKCPIKGLKYMIELDRRGKDDCVFYDCYNEEFIDYVERFGFKEQWGSFSDISFLMEAWKTCGVNLSVGYFDEHSVSETLHLKYLFKTIEKVKVMLQETDIPEFEYRELVYDYSKLGMLSPYSSYATVYGQHCSGCKNLYSEYDLFPAKGADGLTKYFCPDCIVGRVEWCDYCGEAFEICSNSNQKICKECEDKLCTTTSNNNSKES